MRNKQSAERVSTDKIVTQHGTSHEPSGKEKQHILSQANCDRSTQTETPKNMFKDQSTQTIPLEHILTQTSESKSTQTQPARLSYKQLYESQASVNEGQDGSPDQCRNPEQLIVLIWNIDGLDPEDLRERIPSLLLHLGK